MSDPHGTIGNYRKGGSMTAEQLIEKIYEENFSHVDFMDNMGGDCDCAIHITLNTMANYMGIEVNA